MKWSWRVGAVAGVDIRIHATFLILVAWVVAAHWLETRTLGSAVYGLLFILGLFACVLLHELGHALVARRYRIVTRDITLLPIGGVARLERMPEKPREELWVALAGPAVNVVIGTALLLWLGLGGALEPLGRLRLAGGPLLERLMVVNFSLAAFNLLPAFPMDGGRVVRALLASRLDYPRATHIAATIGQGMAFLFGLAGLFWNPFLLLIALFVWIGAAQESSLVQMRSALGGIPVSHAMITHFRTLSPEDTLAHARDLILSGSQQDFPVVSGENVLGVLTRSRLVAALAERGETAPVGEVMQAPIPVVEASEMLDAAFRRLQDCACTTLPVVHQGRLIGLVTSENLGEFLMIQAALDRARGRGRGLFVPRRF